MVAVLLIKLLFTFKTTPKFPYWSYKAKATRFPETEYLRLFCLLVLDV